MACYCSLTEENKNNHRHIFLLLLAGWAQGLLHKYNYKYWRNLNQVKPIVIRRSRNMSTLQKSEGPDDNFNSFPLMDFSEMFSTIIKSESTTRPTSPQV